MPDAYGGHACSGGVAGLAGLAQGVVARVKVLAVLQLSIQQLRGAGHAAVHFVHAVFLGGGHGALGLFLVVRTEGSIGGREERGTNL